MSFFEVTDESRDIVTTMVLKDGVVGLVWSGLGVIGKTDFSR